MIRLPIFTSLRVEHYGLFPNQPNGDSLEWVFDKGLSVIAGVNGSGKTTLLMMLLRSLTGPYDLSGTGVPDLLESILPAEPVSLKPTVIRFFRQRVADQAEKATVSLKVRFGTDDVEIARRLSDLSLLNFRINDQEETATTAKSSRERKFQEKMCSLFDLGSFVDVILILHHIIFFAERRPGALWDENAQRHIIRALFLDKELAIQVASLERRVQGADSRARNFSASAFRIQERLGDAQTRDQYSPGAAADLALVIMERPTADSQ
jgi:hypothetical protein